VKRKEKITILRTQRVKEKKMVSQKGSLETLRIARKPDMERLKKGRRSTTAIQEELRRGRMRKLSQQIDRKDSVSELFRGSKRMRRLRARATTAKRQSLKGKKGRLRINGSGRKRLSELWWEEEGKGKRFHCEG